MALSWLNGHIIELFGAVTGIAYVILEIRRNILLWPLGIITSAIYIYVFGTSGFYANMGLQGYYLVISVYGWYMWQRQAEAAKGAVDVLNDSAVRTGQGADEAGNPAADTNGGGLSDSAERTGQGADEAADPDTTETGIRLIERATAAWCLAAALLLWLLLWLLTGRGAGSPVAVWDGLIASLSVVATWMLTRKYIELWYVWIVANAIAMVVYLAAGLYPTALLFLVYSVMAIVGLIRWRAELKKAD